MDVRRAMPRSFTLAVLSRLLVGCSQQRTSTETAAPPPPPSSSIAPVTPPAAIAAPGTLPPVEQAVTPELLLFQLCHPEELVAPIAIAPEPSSVQLALTPTFSWSYPLYCAPTGYYIEICADPTCRPSVVYAVVDPQFTSWVPQSPLDESTQYFWRVGAMADLPTGPYIGPWSSPSPFFTGPLCAAEDLLPPALTEPEPDAHVDAIETSTFSRLTLRWESAGACLPSAYQVQLSLS